jgi:XTP/dITP diphosphohydrolase
MRLLIATKNTGKFTEISEVLSDLDLELYHLKMSEMQQHLNGDYFEENGETFEENAEKKALHYNSLTGIPAIGEDSGIIVDALKGELGVKTRRWGAGENATDEEWIEYFMKVMEDVPEENRTARFICAAAFIDGGGEVAMFRGQTEGIITKSLEADLKPGIPLSSCFRPEGQNKVYAALSEKEKNSVSHRGKAFHELKNFLKSEYNI